ncbi:bifunctional adenosylcobinamide kinase/adenosylcobinamide-phosphate guanylyltransferase [Alteriqipengyuania lutimaris]|uniref:Adenosylcobinamide kinase n=1 Tax=Alteriqipengyuania lutimaris TaxID=1538146 RepID=A0A395LT41_9SPHN|nr:bifunctional adenosylcobinamide kinase/adenosylcobinamide-phosphate guanylyltransferase [Alteriqipengyuania lutimaris]
MLVLGGARSGKSHYAQQRTELIAGKLVFIGTAQPFDDEMQQRIERHRADRGDRWQTIEAPFDLIDAIRAADRQGDAILIDCLTLWLSNLMLAEMDVPGEELCATLAQCRHPVTIVSNEVGYGIVPENSLARRFRDQAGRLNQRVAQTADTVVLVAAGLPLFLKS